MLAFDEVGYHQETCDYDSRRKSGPSRQSPALDDVIGNSPQLRNVLRHAETVAATNSTVLILGESGTGKELIAQAIHALSPRSAAPLIKVNCAAISAGLVESELFGHEKGSFTGAASRRTGRFEAAAGGTLFLDEVGELPLDTQVKLLRVLQEGEFERVGSNETIKVDVRIIAATNRCLESQVRAGEFRLDLMYRLNVFPLHMPPLRDRLCDIPGLVEHFLAGLSERLGMPLRGVSKPSMERLMRYDWPGNVRELQNVIERAAILSRGPIIEIEDLAPETVPIVSSRDRTESKVRPLPTLEAATRSLIVSALEKTNGMISGKGGAAEMLDVNPNTLRSRMKKLGILRSACNLRCEPGHSV